MSPLLLLRPAPSTAPLPTLAPAPGNVLGCANWEAALYERGGKVRVGTLTFSELSGERVRGPVPSAAQITIPAASSCNELLRICRPWSHELHFFRGGHREWLGPIQTIDFPGDGDAVIHAADLSVWPEVTPLEQTLSFNDDAAEVYATLLALALVDQGVNAQVAWSPIGVTYAKTYYSSSAKALADPLEDLNRVGVNATVLGRNVYVGPSVPLTDRSIRLLDQHFVGRPDVTLDGTKQATEVWVAGGQASETLDPVLIKVADVDAPVRLVRIERDASVVTPEQAEARARDRLSRSSRTPVVFNGGTLEDSAPVLFDELVPGLHIGVTLSETVAPVAGVFELLRMTFTASPQSEAVAVEVQPLGGLPE